MQMESHGTCGHVVLCLFAESGFVSNQNKPLLSKFKIDSKANGNLIFMLQHFHFWFSAGLFKLASKKKSRTGCFSA